MEFQISVVIPSYEPNLNTLTECVKAVFDSNFKPFEVILVDDGSYIDYPEEIKTHCRFIKNKRNAGPACARNIGSKEAKGNILFFLDSDVKIANDTFSKIVEKFSYEDIEVVQTIYSKFSPIKNFLSQYQNLYQHYNFRSIEQKYLCRCSAYAVAVKRNVFLDVGGFPEFVKNASIEDGLLGMALYSKGYKILLAKDIQVEHLAFFDTKRFFNRMFIMGKDTVEHFGKQNHKMIVLSKTHHSVRRIVSILLSPLILVFLMTAIVPMFKIILIFFMTVFLLFNINFFIFLNKYKGMMFMLRSIIIYYLACLSIFLGVLKGAKF